MAFLSGVHSSYRLTLVNCVETLKAKHKNKAAFKSILARKDLGESGKVEILASFEGKVLSVFCSCFLCFALVFSMFWTEICAREECC
jgi:hypothetical protein